MQDIQYSTFSAECHFNLSTSSSSRGQFNQSVPEYEVVICGVQFEDIQDSPIKQRKKRIHHSKCFDAQDFNENPA
jgi:hypothetical protein